MERKGNRRALAHLTLSSWSGPTFCLDWQVGEADSLYRGHSHGFGEVSSPYTMPISVRVLPWYFPLRRANAVLFRLITYSSLSLYASSRNFSCHQGASDHLDLPRGTHHSHLQAQLPLVIDSHSYILGSSTPGLLCQLSIAYLLHIPVEKLTSSSPVL